MPNSFADRYRAAMRETGCCPIEAGLLGRLADHECAHGRLPGDRTAKCGCWPQENASDHRHHPAGTTAERRTEGRLTGDGQRGRAPLPGRRLHRPGPARAAHVRAALAAGAAQAQTRAAPSVAGRPRAPAPARTAPPPKHASRAARSSCQPACDQNLRRQVRRFLAGYRHPNHTDGESWDEEDITRLVHVMRCHPHKPDPRTRRCLRCGATLAT